MGRFLIFFSYLGHRYSGLQSQRNALFKNGKPIPTVQDALAHALKELRPANEIRIALSSRTDKGVHALRNSCTVDLQYPQEGKEYNPDVITQVMNYNLGQEIHEIRVLETRQVPPTVHARRNACARKYIYRLAHRIPQASGAKSTDATDDEFMWELMKFGKKLRRQRYRSPPLGDDASSLDAFKVFMLRGSLDVSKLLSAAELLSGVHNFTAFTSKAGLLDDQGMPLSSPIKLLTVGVRRGQALGARLHGGQPVSTGGGQLTGGGGGGQLTGHGGGCGDQLAAHDGGGRWPHLEGYEYWDIHIEAKSFLYKMVRRLVGAMTLHARGKMSLSDLRDLLDNPRTDHPFAPTMMVPETGLFLQDVLYDQQDLRRDFCPIPHRGPSQADQLWQQDARDNIDR